MKSIIENMNESVSQKTEYEEIADIPEAISDGITIDGEEDFGEESVVEVDLKDYEELGVPDIRSLKSMTILDELESDNQERNSLVIEKESINIEKLTIKIDGLTSVHKRNKIQKQKKVTKSSSGIETETQAKIKDDIKEKDKKEIAEIVEELRQELKHEIRQEVKEEVKHEVRSEVKEEVKQEIKQEVKQEVKEKVKQEIRQEKTDSIEERIAQIEEDINARTQSQIIEKENERDKKEIAQIVEELKQEIRQIKINSIDEKIEEKIERTLERREKETKQSRKENHISEIKSPQQIQTDITEKIETESVKEVFGRATETITRPNTLTIDIPDQLLGELPENFNIDELGKINLKEAEIIAEEDILSWANSDILEELEDLDLLAEKTKKVTEDKQKEKQISISTKAAEKKAPALDDLKKDTKDTSDKTEEKAATKETTIHAQVEEKKGKDPKEKKVEISKKDAITKEPVKTTTVESGKKADDKYQLPKEEIIAGKEAIDKKTDSLPAEKKAIEITPVIKTGKISTVGDNTGIEIRDENVFIIENENGKEKDNGKTFSEFDELENIASSIVDIVEGKAKQLHESDAADKKAITGLIRDNYPTFKDLLKEKEISNKQVYSDDDITFVDNSFLSKEQTTKFTKFKDKPEEIERTKTAAPFEQMLGLAAEDFDLIENQLFKIKDREIDLEKTTSTAPGLDQHPSDTLILDQYKYILPTPDSLHDGEKKSIEDDITAPSALIYEEDVDKIRKKLEDSMKKKIEETIQDITDKITIFEDNKIKNNSSESNVKDKDEIKRLLKYLNDLMDKLPKETIENFANSEYYDLYKKVLKEMDI